MSGNSGAGGAGGGPPVDFQVYAAIQWAISALHKRALDAYWKDKGNWDAIRDCLGDAYVCLDDLAKNAPGDSCPFEPCGDGSNVCRPICQIGP